MQEKIKYGSVTKEYKLDDDGSTVKATVSSKGSLVQPIKLVYEIRHRIDSPSQESDVYRIFDQRHMMYPLFDSGITFEKKNRLNPKTFYYMIEHFTMYKQAEETPHVQLFVDELKKELGL